MPTDAERQRLVEAESGDVPWRRWGPYLAERAWGTVREDYSPKGDAWESFPHDHARSRAYRWNEDGLLGVCDDQGRLCFALALWNEADPILKERLFGLSGKEGNHGEDVKEQYFYLDSTPTHSYMRALYKYPCGAFPYLDLLSQNRQRTRLEPEYELLDTGIFSNNRYFDVEVEYAKANADDIVIRVTATNCGTESAPLRILPTLWFRNRWVFDPGTQRPLLRAEGESVVHSTEPLLGEYRLYCNGSPEFLFTENETNSVRLWGTPNTSPWVKDGIGDAIVGGHEHAVNPNRTGTKCAAHYRFTLAPGESQTVLLRLSAAKHEAPFADAEAILRARRGEADAFYDQISGPKLSPDERLIQRQAFAGLLWSKQFYHFDVNAWLEGDNGMPPPAAERRHERDADWRHLHAHEILSMPDTWEYPWFAAWDLAFQCVPLSLIDPEFAKSQLLLLLREWYMHPNGQLPAYEWAFGDANPPVHAWAAWRVYKIARDLQGHSDRTFLARVFHKLLLNFTWWVNRKDSQNRNVFQGGFLGLDNISVFNRAAALPTGGELEQSDATAWMAFYCLTMMAIAIELAREDHAYEDMATKFFEHFLYIANAMDNRGEEGLSLWDDVDNFFYDVIHLPGGEHRPLRVRSIVGLIPLLAVETVDSAVLDALPDFQKRMQWFLDNRPDLAKLVARWHQPGVGDRHLFSLLRGHRMKQVLHRMLDPEEFLGPTGIRSMSKYHQTNPYSTVVDGQRYEVRYEPAESSTGLFGGNSNWRGPVWFPLNFLIAEAMQRFHHYYGDDFLVECPTGSGQKMTLDQVANDLCGRLIGTFTRGADGRRRFLGDNDIQQNDPHWHDLILFHEYFHGDTGAGLGASHQTGWTALVAKLIDEKVGRTVSKSTDMADPSISPR